MLLLSSFAFAQNDSLLTGDDLFWNNLLEENLTEADESGLSEGLESQPVDPLDLNKATLEDLLRIPFLSYQDAKLILEYRKTSGIFFSPNELYMVKGIPKPLIQNVLPFLFVSSYKVKSTTSSTLKATPELIPIPDIDFRSRMQSNSLFYKALNSKNYSGSPIRLYNRLKVMHKGVYQLGFILEKDPGEKSFTDFSSFHLSINSLKPFTTVVFGDYNLESGQGLALWSPYGFLREGSAVSSFHMQERSIRPYLSSDENSFLRGAAISLSLSSFSLSAFYSNNFRDANTDTASGKVVSFYTSGYHRTYTELQKKDKLREVLFGTKMDYTVDDLLTVGALLYRSEFSRSFLEESPLSLSGNSFNMMSLYWKVFLESVFISGEAAYAMKKPAFTGSLELILTDNISALVQLRHIESGFPSMHSFFSGSTSGCLREETGVYGGINIKTLSGTIEVFYDQFKKQKAQTILPASGHKFGISYSHCPMENLKLKLRYRNGDEEICDLSGSSSALSFRQSRSYKADIQYNFSAPVFIRFHAGLNRFQAPLSPIVEKGFIIFEETGFSREMLSLSARIACFKTDSYNSRIFQTEYDTPGNLVSFPLFGQGVKWYINCRFRILSGIQASMKYSETYLSKTKASSPGTYSPEEENSSFSLQLDVKL
ncbi:MAG: helix-hairpin-helix domain-containing protein [Ignavibacteria bacterium]|nr:helix-hairpin-helix domain-containing protein [Ignavibacteria bacterium]MCU7502278.1 helix-hairpin-helix domain-containing protein [Ignavibacteria bacterium]MCU7516678.1 helix-hairpin-helix domain-containing protein [Ignavibacteria bacterium]